MWLEVASTIKIRLLLPNIILYLFLDSIQMTLWLVLKVLSTERGRQTKE